MATYVVRGKKHFAIPHNELVSLRSQYQSCLIDIGAGDGKGSWRYARSHPETFVIALDANHDALTGTAQKATKKIERGGTENLVCLYGNIRESSVDLFDIADEIRVILPWGDLLEGIAEIDEELLDSLVDVAKDTARISIVINAEIWNNNLPKHLAHLGEITPQFFTENTDQFAQRGIHIEQSRVLSLHEIEQLDTTWTAKLMSSRSHADFVMATGVVQKNVH